MTAVLAFWITYVFLGAFAAAGASTDEAEDTKETP